jgi:hypothetical protein
VRSKQFNQRKRLSAWFSDPQIVPGVFPFAILQTCIELLRLTLSPALHRANSFLLVTLRNIYDLFPPLFGFADACGRKHNPGLRSW